MNFSDWYTDKMDIYRIVSTKTNGLTRNTLPDVPLYANVPCRIYRSKIPPSNMQQTAANIKNDNKLMCALSVDIHKGDMLMVTRNGTATRYFVGDMQEYSEPFGAVMPGLAHKEISILQEERIK